MPAVRLIQLGDLPERAELTVEEQQRNMRSYQRFIDGQLSSLYNEELQRQRFEQ